MRELADMSDCNLTCLGGTIIDRNRLGQIMHQIMYEIVSYTTFNAWKND